MLEKLGHGEWLAIYGRRVFRLQCEPPRQSYQRYYAARQVTRRHAITLLRASSVPSLYARARLGDI